MIRLYHSVIQPPQHVKCCAVGKFTGTSNPDYDEIAVSLGTYISIFAQIQMEQDIMKQIVTEPMYSHIFNLATLSPTESEKDYLVVMSDAANIVIFDLTGCTFKPIISLPYGRTGLRRVEPGYYLSVSPCGRAIFSSALEKFKLAWSVSKNDKNLPTLSSPLENSRSKTFVYSTVALDVGYESPKFCCIEVHFKQNQDEPEKPFIASSEPKFLTFYQLDTTINFLARCGKRDDETPLPPTASLLVSVPGPLYSYPGGVIVCSHGKIQYFNNEGSMKDEAELPHRENSTSIIVCSAAFCSANGWFILLQNQFGDLLYTKIQPNYKLQCQYFDTVPVASSIAITNQGTLCLFGESCANNFYYVTGACDDVEEGYIEKIFAPSAELTHLDCFEEHNTMSRLTKLITVPSTRGSAAGDILSIHGSGQRSSLKVTRKGMPVRILKSIEIGGGSSFVKSIKRDPLDEFDAYIFVSNETSTRILEFYEETRELKDTESNYFVTNAKTLDVFVLPAFGCSSIAQVHQKGIRVVEQGKTHDWSRGDDSVITNVTANPQQIAVTFSDNTIAIFETDEKALPNEITNHRVPDIAGNITAIAIPQPPEGVRFMTWLAVAAESDGMTVIYIVNISKSTEQWSISSRQILENPVTAMMFTFVPGVGHILHIGHNEGLLTRTTLDDTTGTLDNVQLKFLGNAPVSFNPIYTSGKLSLLINAATPWISNGFNLTQLSSQPFVSSCQYKAPFFIDDGYIGITRNKMVLFYTPDKNIFIDTQTLNLPMSPRQIVHISDSTFVCVLMSDMIDGQWKSFAALVNYDDMTISNIMEFPDGIMIASACYLPKYNLVACGAAKNLSFFPKKSDGGVAFLLSVGKGIPEIVQTTDFEDIPQAVAPFGDFMLMGVQDTLMVMKIGKMKLLKKSCSKSFPHCITFITSFGTRIIVGDSAESFHFVKFDRDEDILSIFADDMVSRHPLCAIGLDRSTVCCGDKFGSFCILRLPEDISDEAEVDPSEVGHAFENENFPGARNKLELASFYHIGCPITGLSATQGELQNQSLVYGTVDGEVGLFIPLRTDTDAHLFRQLEDEIRKIKKSPLGRSQEMFRSYYAPVKYVQDSSLLRAYTELKNDVQKQIAEKLKVKPFDLSRLLAKVESSI